MDENIVMGGFTLMLAADGLLKSPLKLIGAKTGIKKDSPRKRIYDLLPADCTTYMEPFLGSGSILFGKRQYGTELVNDINPWVINFFEALRAQPMEVLTLANRYISSLDETGFKPLRGAAPHIDANPIKAAAWYYTVNKFARNGIVRFDRNGKCNSTWCKTDQGRGLLTEEWLAAVLDRIRDVHFRNLSWRDFLDDYPQNQGAETIVVLDPPYSQVFTKYDKIAFTDEDHKALAKYLTAAKFRWLLTINDNAFIRDLYRGQYVLDNPVHWQCSNTVKGRGIRNELIIRNYLPPGESLVSETAVWDDTKFGALL
ncbi:MAG: DNA adenine methylase [Patescibacteria group bacterium]|nr:DNA adenine methylase [Patescibacteria group bacterium]